MKRRRCRHEVLAFARMKRSTPHSPPCGEATLHSAKHCFIFHAPQGVLHWKNTIAFAIIFFLWLQNEKDIWGKWWMVLNPRDFLMIYRWRDMIYSWCRMIYFRFAQIWYKNLTFGQNLVIRFAHNNIRFFICRRHISSTVGGYHIEDISPVP